MGAKYQWSPDPVLAAVVGVVTVIIVLIPAVCSVCFRIHLRRHQHDQVRGTAVNWTSRISTLVPAGAGAFSLFITALVLSYLKIRVAVERFRV